jgi:hypothetical protein
VSALMRTRFWAIFSLRPAAMWDMLQLVHAASH